jgi:anti-sigma B factor antagonist
MTYRIEDHDGHAVLHLDGEIDLDKSPAARAALLECVDKYDDVVVDMSAVEYIDSSGVASLVEALQRARGRRVGFRLARVSPAATKVLALARLDKVFTIIE